MEEVDRFKALIDVARSQSGFFTRGQFEYLGLPDLDKQEKKGDVESWDHSIYRLSGFHRSSRDDLYYLQMALVDHDGWPATAFSHHTALYVHQLTSRPERYQCRLLKRVSFRQSFECLFIDRRIVPAENAVKVDGLWVTDLATTFADLLSTREDNRILVAEAVTDAVTSGALQPEDLESVPTRHREFIMRSAGWLKQRVRLR